MKIDKLNIEGKKTSIEVKDKIFAAKINKQLVSDIIYKSNANYKGRKAKTKQKNEITGSTSKIYMLKKELVMRDTRVERLQFLLVVVLLTDQKARQTTRSEK